MRSVSIKDIAQEVGVSTTTVSFVLNGKAKEKRISNELRDKILKTAERLNYRPNQVARGLRTGQTHTLGLIVEDIANPFFAHLARFVEDEADKAGYKVMFCSTENNDEKAISLLYLLRHRQMDGFIIIPTRGIEKEIQSLAEEKKPVVLVDRYFPGADISYVTVDNYKGAFDGAQLLLSKGYKNIVLVTLDSEQVQMTERERGFVEAIASSGKVHDSADTLHLQYDLTHPGMVKSIAGFLSSHPNADAVFFTTNYLGVAGVEAIRNLKKTIPGQIAVISFDDNDLFRLGSPTISVISQPIREIGKKAVEMILHMINTKSGETLHYVLKPEVMARESV